jgi:hypothetical protein
MLLPRVILFAILASIASGALLTTPNGKPYKLLVLGGTGFVGRTFIQAASRKLDCEITSVSRRGKLEDEKDSSVRWISGDATDGQLLTSLCEKYGPFDACIHAVGLLFDNESGLQSFNKFVSGSGSEPTSKSTYDRITRQTAFLALESLEGQTSLIGKKPAFIFVSAAEAGWTTDPPIPFLQKYLIAKRAVEEKITLSEDVRAVIFRPSLIWTTERPQALASVIPFTVANFLGVPGVDRPVMISTLTEGMVAAVYDQKVSGIKRYSEMDGLQAQYNKRST